MKTLIKFLYLIALELLLSDCCHSVDQNNNEGISNFQDSLFTLNNENISVWEIATTDSINHLAYYFYKKLGNEHWLTLHVGHRGNQLYNHGGRRMCYESLIKDSIYEKIKPFEEIIFIDQLTWENKNPFITVILRSNDRNILLRYKYTGYSEYTRIDEKTLDRIKLDNFIKLLDYNNIHDSTVTKYSDDCIVSIISKNHIQIYPYLNNRFSGRLDSAYMDLVFKD